MSNPAHEDQRWYLGSMNDGLFIINRPSRPSNDDVWYDRPDGPTTVLNVTELPAEKAEAIVDAHNAVVLNPAAFLPIFELWADAMLIGQPDREILRRDVRDAIAVGQHDGKAPR